MGFHEHGNVIFGFKKVGEILCPPDWSHKDWQRWKRQRGGVGEGNPRWTRFCLGTETGSQ